MEVGSLVVCIATITEQWKYTIIIVLT